MNNSNISNIRLLDEAYSSIENRTMHVVDELRKDYVKYLEENVFYKKKKGIQIVVSLIVSIGLFFLIGLVLSGIIATGQSLLKMLILFIVVISFLKSLYSIGINVYCKKVEKYEKTINDIGESIKANCTSLKSGTLYSEIENALAEKKELVVSCNNSIGAQISAIRNEFSNTNKRAFTIKRNIRFGVTATLYIVLILFVLIGVGTYPSISGDFGLSLVFLNLLAIVVVSIGQMNIGEYLGKKTKLIGCVMALFYAIFLFLAVNNKVSMPFIETFGSNSIFNKIGIVIALMQGLSIALVVFCTHYGLLIEKFEQGFEVPMSYGSKSKGTKFTLISRMVISLLFALGLCFIVVNEPINGIIITIIFAVLWYFSNCLVKPRGSYLYVFWGLARSIANEFVLLSMVLTATTCSRGTISSGELLCIIIGIVGSFVVGCIATYINNNVII